MRPLSGPPRRGGGRNEMHNKMKCNKIFAQRKNASFWEKLHAELAFLQADNCRFLHPLIAIVVNNKT